MGNPLKKIGAVFDFPWVMDETNIEIKTISLDLLEAQMVQWWFTMVVKNHLKQTKVMFQKGG